MSDLNKLYDQINEENRPHLEGAFPRDESIARRRRGPGVIFEGDDGVFTQSWFPICRSSELPAGKVLGTNFLDGQVVAFRDAEGTATVVSAYCPHNGANLANGDLVEGELRCAFHHWCFDGKGSCTRTGSGDPVPPRAKLFKYPTVERYGLIWAFNGEQPLWELPALGLPDEELTFHAEIPHIDLLADPWIFMCNTLDFNHVKCLHGIDIDGEDPAEDIIWGPHSVSYDLTGTFRETGAHISYSLAIHGSNIFLQTGEANGRWFAFLFPLGLLRPGTQRCYFIIATRKSDGTPEDDAKVKETLDFAMELERFVVSQDISVLNSIRFTRGQFTRSDKALAKFLDHIARFPRSHPGAAHIR